MIAALAAVALSIAAAAPVDVPITVTGVRLTPEAIHATAVDFVRATGIAAGEVSAARWTTPVCPRAIGLNDEPAAIVEAKLRQVAADAGIAVAAAPCQANIAVVFATDGGGVVRAMVGKSPKRFAGLRPAAVRALTDGPAPIRWWYTSELSDKDGVAAGASGLPSSLLGGAEGGGSPISTDENATFVQHYSTSLISTGDVRSLRTATVVVDIARTDGLPLNAVASFAAMVALAEIRPGAIPPDSVLGLFAGAPVLRFPSVWDIALLRALYRLPLDRTAQRQRGRLVADLVAARSAP